MNVKVDYTGSKDAEVAGSHPEARNSGMWNRGQQVARVSLKETHFAATCSRDLDLGGVFQNPRHSGWSEGHWARLRMGESFLCLPLFPAPRLWRVYFQVGSHFH